jgi:hypothetical protein
VAVRLFKGLTARPLYRTLGVKGIGAHISNFKLSRSLFGMISAEDSSLLQGLFAIIRYIVFSLLSKNLKIKIQRTVIFPVVLCGCEN